MSYPKLTFTVILLLGFHSGIVSASAIHKWIDANGMIRYSETPPQTAIATVRIEIDAHGYAESSPSTELDRLASLASQWKQISRERRERLQGQPSTLQQIALGRSYQPRPFPLRHVFVQRSGRTVVINSRRAYRRHGYQNGRHYLHDYRPGGQPYLGIGFPSVN